jgi:hypothetical protein
VLGAEVARNLGPLRPAHADPREWLGNEKAVPRFHHPSALGLQMKGADGSAGELGELDGAHLGLIDGAERAVGGEDGGAAALDHVDQAHQAFARASRTGAAHGIEAEHPENAGDEFAVEAAADEDNGARAAEVNGAGEDALVPETVNLGAGFLTEYDGGDAFFSDDAKAPGETENPEQRPHNARNNGQDESLGEGKAWTGAGGHSDDFSCWLPASSSWPSPSR